MYFLSKSGKLRSGKRDGAEPPTSQKEVTPMSIDQTIALLMLVIAAVKLGYDLKR